MAMPIFTDQEPEVKARGDLFVYTYHFDDQKIELVLTRYAAMRAAMFTLQTLDEPPREDVVRRLETAAK